MLLIHISDLHFRAGEVGTAMDPNGHLRNALTADAESMCKRLKLTPDAILISGDLAFAGESAEYDYADHWLHEFCQKCGAQFANVVVIPGNHDVVRKKASQTLVRTLHHEIKGTSDLSSDSVIRALLTDSQAGPLLYQTIEPYNTFAQQLFCSLLPPERTFCERELTFPDGSKLRIIGLNSTFVSSEADKEKDLFVDPSALQITSTPGVENLVMCHHPYPWLRNGERFQDHLRAIARIHLFGHVHTSRITLGRDFVQIAASAAHPDRTEWGWEPGYNLIELEIEGTGAPRTLVVKIHVRIWQQRPGEFHAKVDKGRDVFENRISLDPWTLPSVTSPVLTVFTEDDQKMTTEEPDKLDSSPGGDSMDKLRDISIRFFKLTVSQKALIAGKLELLEDEDKNLPDFERSRRILLRAKDRKLIDELDQEVQRVAVKD